MAMSKPSCDMKSLSMFACLWYMLVFNPCQYYTYWIAPAEPRPFSRLSCLTHICDAYYWSAFHTTIYLPLLWPSYLRHVAGLWLIYIWYYIPLYLNGMSYLAGPSIDQCYILSWIQPFIIWISVCLHLKTISLAEVFSTTLSGQCLHHTLCMLKMLSWAEHFMQDFMQSMSGNIWMDHLSHPCLSIIVIAFLSGWPLTILLYITMVICWTVLTSSWPEGVAILISILCVSSEVISQAEASLLTTVRNALTI